MTEDEGGERERERMREEGRGVTDGGKGRMDRSGETGRLTQSHSCR